jgi:hypothetical protein
MTDPVILVAREPRSRFGRLVKWSFWLFQLLMLAVTLGTCAAVFPYAGSEDPEVAAGAAMFGVATLGFAWAAWPLGTIILGILLLVTRGRRRLVALPPAGQAASRPASRPGGSVPQTGKPWDSRSGP